VNENVLKLGVICKCILGVSRSSSIMTIFDNSYQSYAPFCTLSSLNFWFPDDTMWAKSQIEAMYRLYVYLMNIWLKFNNINFSTIFTRVMPFFCTSNLLNFWFPDNNRWTKSQIEAMCGMYVYIMSYTPFCTSNLLNIWFLDDNLWAKRQMCGVPFRHLFFFFFFPVWSELVYECWNSSAWWVNSKKSCYWSYYRINSLFELAN